MINQTKQEIICEVIKTCIHAQKYIHHMRIEARMDHKKKCSFDHAKGAIYGCLYNLWSNLHQGILTNDSAKDIYFSGFTDDEIDIYNCFIDGIEDFLETVEMSDKHEIN